MKGNPAVIGSLLTAAEMEAKLATQYHLDKQIGRASCRERV